MRCFVPPEKKVRCDLLRPARKEKIYVPSAQQREELRAESDYTFSSRITLIYPIKESRSVHIRVNADIYIYTPLDPDFRQPTQLDWHNIRPSAAARRSTLTCPPPPASAIDGRRHVCHSSRTTTCDLSAAARPCTERSRPVRRRSITLWTRSAAA